MLISELRIVPPTPTMQPPPPIKEQLRLAEPELTVVQRLLGPDFRCGASGAYGWG